MEYPNFSKPTHLELAQFWFVAFHAITYFNVIDNVVHVGQRQSGQKCLERSWFHLFSAAMKGEI